MFAGIIEYLEEEEKKIKAGGSVKSRKIGENPQSKHIINKPIVKELNSLVVDNKIIEKKIDSNKQKDNGFDVDKFQKLMRENLIKEYHRSKKYRKSQISVTELLSCPRKIYYNRKNYSIDLNEEFKFSNLYLIRKVGNSVHSAIQKVYNFDESEKTIISEKFNVKGRVDAILGTSIIELKTTDKQKYQDIYDKNHYYQGIIYAYILGIEYGYEITNISIVYIFRDLKSFKVHNLPPDSTLAKLFLDRSLMISDCLIKNIVPSVKESSVPSITDIPEEECVYCSYKKYCDKTTPVKKSTSGFLL